LGELEDKGFTLFIVAIGTESDLEFLEPLGFRVLLDPEMKAFRAYGVTGIPHTSFVDGEGNLIRTSVGWGGDDSLREFMEFIDEMLAG